MPPDFNAVLRTLPSLEPAQLQQLRGKIGALLGLSGVKELPPDVPVVSDYLLNGVVYELRRRGLLGSSSGLPHRLRTSEYSRLSADVQKHLDQNVGPLTVVEATALGQLAVRALASYLERGNIPISPSTLINNISKVPIALDASYPGYLEAGLLSCCWRK